MLHIYKYWNMSYIVFGGLKYHQVRHAINCKKCHDTIEIKHDRDMKYCFCGSVGIGGGPFHGNRLLGNMKGWKIEECIVL